MKLKELQKIEIDMLKAVTDLCDSNGLPYYLYCGTLLGAVRHKGFIPWDDDIDIAMPLKDYRKFLKLSEKLPEPYVIQYPGSTIGYYRNWARVFADGTTFMDRILVGKGVTEFGMHQGFFLDIYPMIGAAKSETGQKIQRGLLHIARELRRTEYFRVSGVKVKKRHKVVALFPYAVRKNLSLLCLRAAMFDPDKSDMIGTIDDAPFRGKYQYDDWKALKKAPFEELEFWIPRRYDKVLTIMYGDYMKLPPEEKRTGHANEKTMIIDADRDYREYQEAKI